MPVTGYMPFPCIIATKVGNHKYSKNGTKKAYGKQEYSTLGRKMRKDILEKLFLS